MNGFKVALVQAQAHKDRERNLKEALLSVETASALGANIVCLPELFLTKYFCQSEDTNCFDLAEPIPGPATDRFCVEAKKEEFSSYAHFLRKEPPAYITTPLS